MPLTYLYPRHMRRGSPVVHAVKKDRHGCWLMTYHDLAPGSTSTGSSVDYRQTNSVRLSEHMYAEFLAEAAYNHKVYKKETKKQRDARERLLAKMVDGWINELISKG